MKPNGKSGAVGRLMRPAVALAVALGTGAAMVVGSAGVAQAAPIFSGIPGLQDLPGQPDVASPLLETQVFPGGPTVGGVLGVPAQGQDSGALAPANFGTPSITPNEGDVVGVAQPIIIRFPSAVSDRGAAEQAMRVTAGGGELSGAFHWFSDTQVRWRPEALWPGNTTVTVQAGDATRTFQIGDAVVATADDATKTITITRNGEVVKTMPTSMGKAGYETPNGIYTVGDKHRDYVMDSTTLGVPLSDPQGYRVTVDTAVRMSNSGIFLHSAPWSMWAQGNTNTSHGCLNVSPADGEWFMQNTKRGDAVVVVNTTGGAINGHDGLTDFSMPWGEWVNE
ncbi:L,D-transpeptidase [Tomitella biformata]|uniref:L,D-transpeptidase n=1 Tax=Tomitella biformata TaxID=630403 RepID=UPI0004B15A83|nr:L,D-transpeptidase [Tomitella biformata]